MAMMDSGHIQRAIDELEAAGARRILVLRTETCVRAANVAMIRGWIAAAREQGQEVIIVTNVLTQSSVMRRLQRDVDGTGAKFNDTGLMQHPRFADWIASAVDSYAGGQ